jgi:hypothetical protein
MNCERFALLRFFYKKPLGRSPQFIDADGTHIKLIHYGNEEGVNAGEHRAKFIAGG